MINLQFQCAIRAEQCVDLLDIAIVKYFAFINNDDAVTQGFHITKVVRGQDDGGVARSIQFLDDRTHLCLDRNIKADGGLIQKYNLRVMQERRGDVAQHALSQRKRADLLRIQLLQPHQFVEHAHVFIEGLLVDLVDFLQNLERLDHGQVPPQLRALTEHHAHDLRLADSIFVRRQSIDLDQSARRLQDARHHFDRGGFARAVRSDIADNFTRFNIERDACHCFDSAVIAREQVTECAAQSLAAVENFEMLAEVFDMYEARCAGFYTAFFVRLS